MAGVVPDSKAFEPTGTLEEIQELGLDPKLYRCCAKQKPGEVAGCQFWGICERPYKGGPPPDPDVKDQDPNEVGGPHHHGILYITAEGNTVQDVRSCFDYAILVDGHRQSGNVYEIVADEGEVIVIKGTREVPINPANPGGKRKAEPFTREELVPKFKRPREVFVEKVYEMRVRENIEKAAKRKRMAGAMGPEFMAMTAENETGAATKAAKARAAKALKDKDNAS
jgi:hypothetical protein